MKAAKSKAKPKTKSSTKTKSPTKTKSSTKAKAKTPAKARAKKSATKARRSTHVGKSTTKAKAGARAKASKTAQSAKAGKAGKASKGGKVRLLTGGNPQIAKGDGDAPVQAYLKALPGWKRELGERLDALITKAVPGVKKAVRWNSPFYGTEENDWFLGLHAITKYMKVAFFRGMSLKPLPPGTSKDKNTRYVDIHEGELDEKQMTKWVKQAAALPGWSFSD